MERRAPCRPGTNRSSSSARAWRPAAGYDLSRLGSSTRSSPRMRAGRDVPPLSALPSAEHVVAALRRRCRDSAELFRYDWNSLIAERPEEHALVPSSWTASIIPTPQRDGGCARDVRRPRIRACALRLPLGVDGRETNGGGFVLATSNGEYRCRYAVFAVGMSEPWRPPTPGIELVPHYDDLQGPRARVVARDRGLRDRQAQLRLRAGGRAAAVGGQLILGSPHACSPVDRHRCADAAPRALSQGPRGRTASAAAASSSTARPERIERTATARASTPKARRAAAMVFEVDEVIATTGFGHRLGDLRYLGVDTFYKDRPADADAVLGEHTVPGIYFAGAATQGQAGMRKYGWPSHSASVGGFRFNAEVRARAHRGRSTSGCEPPRAGDRPGERRRLPARARRPRRRDLEPALEPRPQADGRERRRLRRWHLRPHRIRRLRRSGCDRDHGRNDARGGDPAVCLRAAWRRRPRGAVRPGVDERLQHRGQPRAARRDLRRPRGLTSDSVRSAVGRGGDHNGQLGRRLRAPGRVLGERLHHGVGERRRDVGAHLIQIGRRVLEVRPHRPQPVCRSANGGRPVEHWKRTPPSA